MESNINNKHYYMQFQLTSKLVYNARNTFKYYENSKKSV